MAFNPKTKATKVNLQSYERLKAVFMEKIISSGTKKQTHDKQLCLSGTTLCPTLLLFILQKDYCQVPKKDISYQSDFQPLS